MRTQEEIVERIKERMPHDMFGFEVNYYIYSLDYDHAKPYIKDDVTKESWEEYSQPDAHDVMKEYIPFAFEKARNQRGLSASRSIYHYIAWLWLADDNEIWREIEDYDDYGIEHLTTICEYLGIAVPTTGA